jgi:NADPH2:quinone reductase
VLGAEFSGRIAANSPIPKGCTLKPGDRIFGSAEGAYADKLVVDWKTVLPLPDNLSFDQGAGLHATWATSYEGLVGRGELKAGMCSITLVGAALTLRQAIGCWLPLLLEA